MIKLYLLKLALAKGVGMMKRCKYILVLMVFLFGLPKHALATGTIATQIVTVRAEPLAVISLVDTGGKNWTWLTVDSTGITTGSQELKWTTNLDGMKVTVQSNLATDEQDYILSVRAVNSNSKGASKGWVVINEKASNLITDIAREVGSCSLEYKALYKIGEKAGRDEHIITYTITE